MSIFSIIGGMFKPAADLIDNLHDSKEELGNISVKKQELKNKLAEIESKVAIQILELQSQSIEATAKMESVIQQHGNWFTKSVRPALSVVSYALIVCMAFGFIQYNDLILKICGGYIGVYAGLRTYEKKK